MEKNVEFSIVINIYALNDKQKYSETFNQNITFARCTPCCNALLYAFVSSMTFAMVRLENSESWNAMCNMQPTLCNNEQLNNVFVPNQSTEHFLVWPISKRSVWEAWANRSPFSLPTIAPIALIRMASGQGSDNDTHLKCSCKGAMNQKPVCFVCLYRQCWVNKKVYAKHLQRNERKRKKVNSLDRCIKCNRKW